MKTMYADFNAMTEVGHVCLTTRGSEADIQKYGIRVGDWVWLSDGELVVGAEVREDPRYRVVGVPAWDTLVNLDDAAAADFPEVWSEFQKLIDAPSRSPEDEKRLLQALAAIERKAPPDVLQAAGPCFLALRRADVLLALDHAPLARIELREALSAQPATPRLAPGGRS
jgi:hypothetical protein